MGKAINLKTLNRFIQYPYLIMGWDSWQKKNNLPPSVRQYSVYRMISASLIELVPLPPSLVEDNPMPGGGESRESTRSIYQFCTYSEDWVSPFTKGCVKSLREIIQALEALGLLLPEYWELKDSKDISRKSLRFGAECAYNLLNENFYIKRGQRTMAKNGAVAEVETVDTEATNKPKPHVTLRNECYSEMTQATEVSLYGLKIVYDYLARTAGSADKGVELLTLFDGHINSKKTTYSGMAEPATIGEFISHLRNWNFAEEAIQLSTSKILEEAQDSFDLEAALAQVNGETAKTASK